jgi:hypothetical protein
MKRPNKYPAYDSKTKTETPYYLCSDINPLLDELESLSSQVKLDNSKPTEAKPFPTFEKVVEWYVKNKKGGLCDIYKYFSQFRYEVMPEVGKLYRFSSDGVTWVNFKLKSFNGEFFLIRPIQTPTREEVIEKARQVLSEEEIEILTGG